ncbi:MAG: phosphate ABC transporter permease PstA [Spirochaetaceae bacterium]|jgi:phosphate transport system permease protein|nr:phosphate ABC transporter permease PstA [Spirochaetaceae bacterium]
MINREPRKPREHHRWLSLSKPLVKVISTSSMTVSELLLHIVVWASFFITITVLLYIIGFILVKGLPYVRPSLFALHYTSENVSLLPALVSTVFITLISLLIAVPLSVGAAVYLVEYAKRGNRFVSLIRITTETLAGIPSIIYGLFGMLFFVSFLHWGYSVLAGSLTLSIMILPLVIRSTEEALLAVSDTWREASLALGAGKLRTVFKIVLPAARPGILAGIILAIGRIVGETAALIYTAGTVAQIPFGPLQSARTLSVHMYALSSEGLHTGEAYATAVVLMLLVIVINSISARLARNITI